MRKRDTMIERSCQSLISLGRTHPLVGFPSTASALCALTFLAMRANDRMKADTFHFLYIKEEKADGESYVFHFTHILVYS
jgi:hypothetical protein